MLSVVSIPLLVANDLAEALSSSTSVESSATCASVGGYQPAADHGGQLRVTCDDGTVPQTLTQNHDVVSVPSATNARGIAGLTPVDLLNVNTTGFYVSNQANLQTVYDSANCT